MVITFSLYCLGLHLMSACTVKSTFPHGNEEFLLANLFIYPKQPSCKEKKCCQTAQNSPELSLVKFLPLIYHHSHFLAATLDFTSFFTIAFLRAAILFLQLCCFGLDFTSFCICIPQSWPMASFGAF